MKTVIILLDAVNPSQMKRSMPHLCSLAKKYSFAQVISLLGYSSGIHPSIWSGKYQDEHGCFTTFYYDPKNSPFKWTRYLKIIPTSFLRKNILAALKAPYFLLPGGKRLTPRFIKRSVIPLPPAMPVEIAPFFSCNPLEMKDGTIFQMLDKKGISYSRHSDSRGYFGEYKTLDDMSLTESEIDFFYFYRADELGHIHGPNSSQVDAYLRKADDKIRMLLSEANKSGKKFNFLIFSDHGMCEVKKYVDLQKILRHAGLKNGRDYIAFYDSTMARFWPKNKVEEEKIRNALAKEDSIILLDEKLLKKYRIDFPDKTRYGKMIYLLEPETRIFPDYFAPIKGSIIGWHGFDPEFPDSMGIFIANQYIGKKVVRIVELFAFIKKACLQ